MGLPLPKEKYLYRRLDNGEIVEVEMTYDEMMQRQDVLRRIVLDDGSEAERAVDEEYARSRPQREAARRPAGPMVNRAYEVKPLLCRSSACHRDQVAEFNAKATAGVHYRDDGNVEYSSRRARREEFKRRGLFDADAGYGDRPPGG